MGDAVVIIVGVVVAVIVLRRRGAGGPLRWSTPKVRRPGAAPALTWRERLDSVKLASGLLSLLIAAYLVVSFARWLLP